MQTKGGGVEQTGESTALVTWESGDSCQLPPNGHPQRHSLKQCPYIRRRVLSEYISPLDLIGAKSINR